MEQDNLRIPPLALPAAQQTAAPAPAAAVSPDESTEMHTASPASPAPSSLQPSPLLPPNRAYPSLNNNLYIPHHASIPDPSLFSPSSPLQQHPEDRSYDAEKRSRRHHKHQKSRHERDERYLRNPSFPIPEQVAEMPFHLGKKKARAAAAEAEERAKAQEKRELDEKARRDREAKENREELARRFPFTRTREAVTQARVDELHTKRLEAEEELFDELAEKSGSFSKRIEDTCGNLVNDASVIRGTIYSLQRLSNTALAQHREFLYRTKGVMRNAERHVHNFNKFERQLQSIALLEARLKATEEASKKLDARLDVTRQRIYAWDREEDKWQAKINRRLRILGAAIAFLFLAWVGMKVMGKVYPDYSIFGSKANATLHGNSSESRVAPKDAMSTGTAIDTATGTPTGTPTTGRARSAYKTPLDLDALEEPLQRIIDEL
ncbi:uncharacterized protein ARB_06618 [Trichophyton benhamiae CBS 112371]|uniref:Uncharacterized protein n=1 Tax=Arthroderma benhamiae (strain ATCC MYA-4681 / CBS 112371) TaxID=663331 RepID=D4AQV8_ARTBC|nr:uncharacterized protein ARB_06618 [Trichophyton benhamiae CBS 112371]EFE34852.1 conserved hypothetical protein [Trichophyton benhamiae CBS 112371]